MLTGFVPPSGYDLTNEYVQHMQYKPRAIDSQLDIGAFEYNTISGTQTSHLPVSSLNIFPNPANGQIFISGSFDKASNYAGNYRSFRKSNSDVR